MAFTRQEALITAGEILTGYMFNDKELLWEAEQASGSNIAYRYPEGNKRLAMIGDVVLKLVVLDDLRSRNIPRGSMDNVVQSVVSNTGLERVGRRIHLDEIVNANPSQQGYVSPRIVADTLEAIIGAVYLDSGKDIESVRLVMATLGLWPREQDQLALL
ncbi:hypothetical protein VE03_06134 [Pseudogymnoascus sp. 23342-1-I1]|nr:hypothetical protein VE03_06134 [Pseudogymnoascus sp. 23342-1-I1]